MSGMSGSPSFQGGTATAKSAQDINAAFNNSGWTVSTGSGSASGFVLSPLLLLGIAVAGLLLWKAR